MIVTDCTCHIFDLGHRCDACVDACAAAGHPYTEQQHNGVHHWCGKQLRIRPDMPHTTATDDGAAT